MIIIDTNVLLSFLLTNGITRRIIVYFRRGKTYG